MKLNKISSVFSRAKNTKNNVMIFGTALTAMLAMPTFAADEAPAAEEVEIIKVTGMLGSMKAAAILKRSDGRIVDAIVAEDIGKLPDNNIAEALSRITGVSINTDFGVGDSVSIRGLSENRVELNGRSTAGDDRGGVSLQDFPSSFLKSVSVIKSPTADMIEGALGGTVQMETIRPLELEKLTGAISIDAEYADKTENVAPIFSGSIGNNWDLGDAGNFGASVMLSYQDRELRQDEFFNRVRAYDEDAGGAGAQGEGNTPSGRYTVREQNTVEQLAETRERTASMLSLQWAPESGNGMVYLDVSGTKRSGSQEGSSILDVGGSRSYDESTTQNSAGSVNNYDLTGAFVIPKAKSSFRETSSLSNALGAEWNLTDTVFISGEIAVAKSSSEEPESEFNLRPVNQAAWADWEAQYVPGESDYDDDRGEFGMRHTIDASMNQNGDSIPSVIYSDPAALTSPENLAIRAFRTETADTENDEVAARFDISVDEPIAGLDWFSKVKSGVRVTQRDYSYNVASYDTGDVYKNAFYNEGTAEEKPATFWIDNPAIIDDFKVVTYNNSFDQSGFSGQNDLTTYALYQNLTDTNKAYDTLQGLLAGTNFDENGKSLSEVMTEDKGAFRDISEDTAALYASFYLDFDDVTAIIGGRYIMTDIESSAYNTESGLIENGTNDYADFLPSVNVAYNISDETRVLFAGAKVMRRADFNELSPAFEVEGNVYSATQGALDLDPYRATQFDISVEHYFGEGNMVSFALFYKDVESFLSSETTCRAESSLTVGNQEVTEWGNVCHVTAKDVDNAELVYSSLEDFAGSADPETAGFNYVQGQSDAGLTGITTEKTANGENGEVKGFELGYQQFFDFLPGAFSGLGLSANYTYADSEQPNGNALLDISKNTFNLQGFWEYEEFAFRLAYNYRDEFLDTEDETRVRNIGALALNDSTNDETSESFDSTAGNNYRDARGQLDFSASWDINEHFTVVANATNITGEASIYTTELGNNWKYTEADRRYTVGVRAKF